jgi:hypothetical protein
LLGNTVTHAVPAATTAAGTPTHHISLRIRRLLP